MSQEKLINFIESLCKNTKQNLQQWTAASLDMPESRCIGNIRTTIKKYTKETRDVLHMQHCKTFLELKSYCNEHNCEGGLKMVTFPDVATRPDVWEVHITDPNLLHLLQIKKYSGQRKQHTQYTYYDSESESSMPDMMESIVEDMECDDIDTDEIGLEHGHIIPNLSGVDSADIKHILLTTHRNICTEIIFLLLCGKRGVKWNSLDVESLLNDILCTPESIYKELTSYEIDGVLRVIQRCCTKKCPLVVKPKMKKLTKANFLGHVLGHYYWYIPPCKKVKDMATLSAICRQEVVCFVPEDVMQVGLALWTLCYDLEDWLNSSPVLVTLQIPAEPHEFDILSYPEISTSRSQVESRVIDPSHCLMNLQEHATMKGFFGCDPKAFHRVSTADNNVLSKGLIVQPLEDKQSVSFALKVFSSDVEQTMHNNGDMKEAELVKNVRNWYSACNDRGLLVTECISYFVAMNNYMLFFYKPRLFPMSTTHACGLPSITFQAVLQNILTRIQLYSLSPRKKYNQRAVCTLAVESMFSVLTTLSQTTLGIPLAAKIPCYISRIMQFTVTQYNPDKYVNYPI